MSGTVQTPLRFDEGETEVDLKPFGFAAYDEIRGLQQRLVEERIRGRIEDTLLFGEHPPTVTLGIHTAEEDLGLSVAEWVQRGVAVRRTDRGGGATVHLPGQLVLYPVVSLRERKLGVKRFIAGMLVAMQSAAQREGRILELRLQPPGLWRKRDPLVERNAIQPCTEKVGFVGLRIRHGVTDHGFSLNLLCEVEPFRWFVPCGEPTTVVGSLMLCTDIEKFVRHISEAMERFTMGVGDF